MRRLAVVWPRRPLRYRAVCVTWNGGMFAWRRLAAIREPAGESEDFAAHVGQLVFTRPLRQRAPPVRGVFASSV
jgi:hypothetical protein